MQTAVQHAGATQGPFQTQPMVTFTPRPKQTEMRSPLFSVAPHEDLPRRAASLIDLDLDLLSACEVPSALSIEDSPPRLNGGFDGRPPFANLCTHPLGDAGEVGPAGDAPVAVNDAEEGLAPTKPSPAVYAGARTLQRQMSASGGADAQKAELSAQMGEAAAEQASHHHAQMPVQSLLFSHLAASSGGKALQLPLAGDWGHAQRNSFDFGDKMLELTPGGFQRYRKASQRLASPVEPNMPPPPMNRPHSVSVNVLLGGGGRPPLGHHHHPEVRDARDPVDFE